MSRASLCCLLLLALVAVPGRTQVVPVGPKAEEKKPATVEELPVPPEAILILGEKAADFLRAVPSAVILPPDKYRALMEEIARLKKQAQASQEVALTRCSLSGKVEGGRVELTAKFAFVTERDRVIVPLGCSLGQPTSIQLDGKTPLAWNSSDGLTIQVDKKGAHEAVIEMELALASRTAEPRDKTADTELTATQAGFELDLPLSAISTIELALPPGIKELKVNDQPWQEPLQWKDGRLSGPLHRPTRLKLSWRNPQAAATKAAVLSAEGKIVVRMQPAHATIEAELTLRALGAPVQQWKLVVPPTAEVKLASAADESRLQTPIQGNDGKSMTRQITLKEASNEPLVVIVQQRQPKGTGPMVLGPFAVSGAGRQRGVLFVTAPADQRVRHRLPAAKKGEPLPMVETSLRSASDEERKQYPGLVQTLAYWNVTGGDKGEERAPWLELELEPIQGVLATRLLHTLRLGNGASTGTPRWEWRLSTTVDGLPIRNGVDELRLTWPAPWRMDEERGPRPVDWAHGYRTTIDGKDSQTRFELPRDSLKPFQLTLEALPHRIGETEEVGADELHTVVLPLPRSQQTRDRGNHLITILGTEEVDLSVAQPLQPALELVTQEAGKVVWRAERLPTQVAVAWKRLRPELAVQAIVDVHLAGSQGRLEQRLRFPSPALPRQVLLRVPEAVAERLEVQGGTPVSSSREAGTGHRLIRVDRPATATDGKGELILSCTFPLPVGADLGVPLAVPQQASQGTTQVRVWAEPGGRARLAGASPWLEGPLEVVPEEDRLPCLMLRGSRPDLPLTLRYEPPPGPAGRPVIDRALVHVQVLDGGFQRYRVRLLIREPASQPLELQFPAPLATLDLEVLLDGKRLDYWEGLDDVGQVVGDSGRTARFRLVQARKASVLEVTYQLSPGRTGGSDNLSSVLQPAALPTLPAGVPTRWQVDLPEDWVALPLDGAARSWVWEWHGWLLAPRPALTHRDLESWLTSDEAADRLGEDYAAGRPSLASWGPDLAPLTVYHLPRGVWLLVCSATMVLIGLGLTLGLASPSKSRAATTAVPLRVWALLGGLVTGVVALGIFAPGMMAMLVYGSQPGLVVLSLIVLVQWLLHERYRRRLVYLPGFTRRPPGSSMTQGRGSRPGSGERGTGRSSSNRPVGLPASPEPPREPTTVDAPAAPGSASG